MIPLFKYLTLILLILLGFTHSSFAGLAELFQFEDDRADLCYNIRHLGIAFPEDQKESRREAIRSLIQSMPPEISSTFVDQILAIERRGLFYLDVEQISLFAEKSPEDRTYIVRHVNNRVMNYVCLSSLGSSNSRRLSLEAGREEYVKPEALQDWEPFLNPHLDHKQMILKGPGAECLNRIISGEYTYSLGLVNSFEKIPPDQQEDVIRQVLSLHSERNPLEFGPNLTHLQPFVEVLGSLSRAEREDVIIHTRKISKRSTTRG